MRNMMCKKMSAAKKARMDILQATATIIKDELIPKRGEGYRLSELLTKVREHTKNYALATKQLLAAMKDWLDNNIVRFNNRFIVPTQKGLTHINKLAGA